MPRPALQSVVECVPPQRHGLVADSLKREQVLCTVAENMSRAGKAKSKRVKWLPADREDGADTGQKTGHGKSPEASAVSRGGGDGPIMDPKKIKRYVRFGGKSPNNPSSLQSTASSLAAVGDASSQGEAIEVATSLNIVRTCVYTFYIRPIHP